MPNQTMRLEGTLDPKQEKTYLHLPFEMPDEAARLEVRYAYSHAIGSDPLLSGGNTIDLGVFDTRGIAFFKAGFRGWSGSERATFFITETEATPGYLAGALIPGRWHILLGLYKIAPEGCTYRVDITITTQAGHISSAGLPAPVVNLPASPVNSPFGIWLRGELHCHTWHSDGDTGPEGLVQLARARGLDFLAITDHNTISSQYALAQLRAPGLILLLGVEVTTFHGHLNVWGIGDWIDFRVRDPEQMAAAVAAANDNGAITCCNHPKPFGPPWEYEQITNYQCIEVWNGPWYLMNQMALDFWLGQLAAGRRVPAIGGSDYHRREELEQEPPRAPGTPTTWVRVAETPTAAAILQAIRQGHISLSDNPEGALLELTAGSDLAALCGDSLRLGSDELLEVQVRCQRGAGNQLRLYDQRGMRWEQAVRKEDETIRARLPVRESLYVRAELRSADDDMKALTNPIYFDR